MPDPTTPGPLAEIYDAIAGTRIPGGCEECDAYQTMTNPAGQVYLLTVHHDDWCPWLNPSDAA